MFPVVNAALLDVGRWEVSNTKAASCNAGVREAIEAMDGKMWCRSTWSVGITLSERLRIPEPTGCDPNSLSPAQFSKCRCWATTARGHHRPQRRFVRCSDSV